MPIDDLNQRVQRRLTAWQTAAEAVIAEGGIHELDEFLFDKMIPSWRERWNRHQPSVESIEAARRGLRRLGSMEPVAIECEWCTNDCGDPYDVTPRHWPCPDALAVLREIGIEL